eukprot:m.5653 g.5653  ORF g.5653 m.5653 type:complete len:62 (+) comp3350_c0_seq2:1193-1378(+)
MDVVNLVFLVNCITGQMICMCIRCGGHSGATEDADEGCQYAGDKDVVTKAPGANLMSTIVI